MPLLDFLNHSNLPTEEKKKQEDGPNSIVLPYHDTINNESFVLL